MMRFKDVEDEQEVRVVIVYQNKRTGAEHSIVVCPDQVQEKVEQHIRMGHLVSVIPLQLVLEQAYI